MLKIIISPAKKMNVMEDAPVEAGVPAFLEQTGALKEYLQGLDYGTLKEIWKCNDKLAELNFGRLREMDLRRCVTPAVFAYEGIQYQSMAPLVFEREHLDYIGRHLFILSGFYGILRAFDGVVPYRLEMQAKLAWERQGKVLESLYEYWGRRLYEFLEEGDFLERNGSPAGEGSLAGSSSPAGGDPGEGLVIVNLASQEYAKAVRPWVSPQVRFVDCVFGEEDAGGKKPYRVKATAAKMARGAMVRYMAEHQVREVEELEQFGELGYTYRPELSDRDSLVFLTGTARAEEGSENAWAGAGSRTE